MMEEAVERAHDQRASLGNSVRKATAPTPNLNQLQNAIMGLQEEVRAGLGELEAHYDSMVVKLGGNAHYDAPTAAGQEPGITREMLPERIGHMIDQVGFIGEEYRRRACTLSNLLSQISDRLD